MWSNLAMLPASATETVELPSSKPIEFSGATAVIITLVNTRSSEIRFEARVQITKHNPSWINAFGDDTLQFEIEVSGRIRDRLIEAIMERTDRPGLRLPLRLTRTTLLP